MSADAQRMLALGESGRYEFKRDAEAVSPKVLATLANWVALDPSREVAHLLVGVDEVEDAETGLVYGVPYGLSKGLDKTVARLQDVASKTRPIPVDIFIIEEAVNEAVPLLRVEVRPTMPPHFDDEGRRQTRQGRSTRALTDDELLRIYLDREAGSFAARFRHTAAELREAVGAVGTQVDQIGEAIDRNIGQPLAELANLAEEAGSAASNAAAAAQEVGYDVNKVERLVRDLQRIVQELQDDSLESLAARVARIRKKVWLAFAADTFERSSSRAEGLSRLLHELLSIDISLDEARNSWELRVWEDALSERQEQKRAKGTLKWWTAIVKEVKEFMDSPAYQAPELPDLRAELRGNLEAVLDDPNSLTNQFRAGMT
ncbi:hypothetical protein [Nocardia xishanensis]|uniref:ATP-binding protein n=1 Tax=Nocardia xishanensis TaxID=238964 RepID=A0ABW7XCA2_9NOCA